MPAPRCSRTAPLALAPLAALVLTLAAAPAVAQQAAPAQPAPAAPPAAAPRPPAKPADVESIDAIMSAVYDVISGPAGQARDWDRFRSLFAPSARLVPTTQRANAPGSLRSLSVEDYITLAGPGLVSGGFFEKEIGRRMDRFGNVVHLMSAYESRRNASDPQPFVRGVNSFQLWTDGTRWYVVSIFWQSETAESPIPADLLKKP